MSPLIYILIASIAVSCISLVGGFILFLSRGLVEKRTIYLVSFAAGTMLAAAFLDLLPEAIEGGDGKPIFFAALLGVVGYFFLERFLLWYHHHDEMHGSKPTATLILFGDALHNFIDGIGIAAAFLANPILGFTTTLAIAAHEIPQEMGDMAVLVYSGMSRKKALWLNFCSGLTALLGALIGYYFLQSVETLVPFFLAFTAGMFIYISCSDLIPEIHGHGQGRRGWTQALLFAFGIAVLWGILRIVEG
ncbi:ZIP family metal transporter [Candidatus Uhrbacteria bacterium]|nr:ZIP family metal transporter [Candidatus Uhrbacteria bacterium]